MLRTIPKIRFYDGLATGWAFGVSPAFRPALDISATSRVLSRRGKHNLVAELAREGVETPPGAIDGDAKAMADLFVTMKSAGLRVLDIKLEKIDGRHRVDVILETQGEPPAYSFSIGDIFHDPPMAHKLIWGDAFKILRRSIQISDIQNDLIKATLTHFVEGITTASETVSCTQSEFASLLRTGILDYA